MAIPHPNTETKTPTETKIPHGLPEIPKIQKPENYLEEMLGVSHIKDTPSFFEFLEMRNISPELFHKESLMLLALNSEMMMYNLLVKTIMAQAERDAGEKAYKDSLKTQSIEDLKAQAGILDLQLQYVNKEIEKAAQDLVDQDKTDAKAETASV